jgi:transcription elongation factor Elf1
VAAERALRKLRSEILDMSGTAALLSCTVLAGEQEVRAQFQTARDDEYDEIVDKCHDFLGQVKKEYDENHFTYAELEENEVDLVKLKNWLERVRQRDVFGASGRQAAEKGIEDCDQSLEAYAARVYAEEAESR